ncbi:hypothetical protein QBC34DRAFT_437287 [Podospora aff. communis PSN243]|uniref:MYND-type domain-containing protein n=1 Tax=Podospora aff. communis PSN243 TaxID=3040156 RepID=A0AAV9GV68_9PEZI|nr:hypothetical protein QBC34DRAFT_437287 [Podospora aff. communis PSN243]
MSSSVEGIIAPAAGEVLMECQVCDAAAPVPLSLCGGCRVVYYCCRDHQLEDRPAHKDACKEIVAAKAEVEEKKRALLSWNSEALTPGPQNKYYGVFFACGASTTQDYIRALFRLAPALLKAKTQRAVVESLEVYREMLQLDRQGVGMGIHADQVIAPLLLRLDRDQEAYDFCAWWQALPKREKTSWLVKDTQRPMLDLQGANPIENTKQWYGDQGNKAVRENIIRASSVVLILARLYFGLRMALGIQEKNPTWTSAEVFEKTAEVFPIDILKRHPEWFDVMENRAMLLKEIVIGANLITSTIGQYNGHYWFYMEHPDEMKKHVKSFRTLPGSPEEAICAVEHTLEAWEATPAALDLVMNWTKKMGLRD